MIDACVFDKFAPGDFDMRLPATMQRGTLRRCTFAFTSMQCVLNKFSMTPITAQGEVRVCVGTCRSIVDPQAGTATTSETFQRSADFPQINPAFKGSPDLRCILLFS